MKLRRMILWSAALSLLASAATAQSLALRIENGMVTLDADNVSVDAILARWTAISGLNVVSKNGKGSDAPVSVHVSGVTEREAMTIVLRDLSGYIMGEHRDPRTGIATLDRLMILPQSPAQANTAAFTPLSPRRTSVVESPVVEDAAAVEAEEPIGKVRVGPAAAITRGSNVGTAPDETTHFTLEQGSLVDANGNITDGRPSAPTAVPTAPHTAATPGVIVSPSAPPGPLRTTPRLDRGDQSQ